MEMGGIFFKKKIMFGRVFWIWPPPLCQAAVSFSKFFERWDSASQKFCNLIMMTLRSILTLNK